MDSKVLTSGAARSRLAWLAGSALLLLASHAAWDAAQAWGAEGAAMDSAFGGRFGLWSVVAGVGVIALLWRHWIALGAATALALFLFVRLATMATDPGLAHEVIKIAAWAALSAVAATCALLAMASPRSRSQPEARAPH
jgi:hypothetical protein